MTEPIYISVSNVWEFSLSVPSTSTCYCQFLRFQPFWWIYSGFYWGCTCIWIFFMDNDVENFSYKLTGHLDSFISELSQSLLSVLIDLPFFFLSWKTISSESFIRYIYIYSKYFLPLFFHTLNDVFWKVDLILIRSKFSIFFKFFDLCFGGMRSLMAGQQALLPIPGVRS